MENKTSQLSQLANAAIITGIFGIIGYVLSFLFKIIIARYFGTSNLGMFTLSDTVLKISVLIGGLGLATGIQRFVPYYQEKKQLGLLKGYLNLIFKIAIVSSIIMSILTYLYSSQITAFFNYPESFTRYLQIISFIIPFRVISEILRHLFVSQKKIVYTQIGLNVIEKITMVVGALIVYFFKLDLLQLFYTFALSIILCFIFELIFVFKLRLNIEIESKKYKIKEWVGFSFPLLLSGIFSFVIGWTDNLFIGKLLDPSQLGIYSTAFAMGIILGFPQSIISSIFMPLISKNYARGEIYESEKLFTRSTSWVFFLTMIPFLILLFFPRSILELAYGVAFKEGYIVLMIIALAMFVKSCFGLSQKILLLHKKTKTIFLTNMVVAIINILGNIFLIPLLGIVGAAISSAISLILQEIIFYNVAKKYQTLTYEKLNMFLILFIGLFSIVISKIAWILGLKSYIGTTICIIIYGIIFITFCLIVKIFNKDDFLVYLEIEKKLPFKIPFVRKIISLFYN